MFFVKSQSTICQLVDLLKKHFDWFKLSNSLMNMEKFVQLDGSQARTQWRLIQRDQKNISQSNKGFKWLKYFDYWHIWGHKPKANDYLAQNFDQKRTDAEFLIHGRNNKFDVIKIYLYLIYSFINSRVMMADVKIRQNFRHMVSAISWIFLKCNIAQKI